MAVTKEKRKEQMVKYAKDNLKRIPLDVPIKDSPVCYNEIKAHADRMGESVNGFIKRAIREAMDRDQTKHTPPEGDGDRPDRAD